MTTYSAQTLTATRLCSAQNCANDAEHRSRLCAKCNQLDSVTLHTTPKPSAEPMLRCCTCKTWLPDEHFSRQASQKAAHRRGRCGECKPCTNTRRRAERERLRGAKTRCIAINTSAKHKRGGQQCRNYTNGTAYCPAHTPKTPS